MEFVAVAAVFAFSIMRSVILAMREPETRIWLYGKRESQPGRKMGHVNRLSNWRRSG